MWFMSLQTVCSNCLHCKYSVWPKSQETLLFDVRWFRLLLKPDDNTLVARLVRCLHSSPHFAVATCFIASDFSRDCFVAMFCCNKSGWFGILVTSLVTSTKLSTSSPVSTGIGDHLWWVYYFGISQVTGPLSVAIPQWVGAISTGGGFGHCWGRNGELCVAVACHLDCWHTSLLYS